MQNILTFGKKNKHSMWQLVAERHGLPINMQVVFFHLTLCRQEWRHRMCHRKEGMPCPRAMPLLPRQQLTAPQQCVAYIRKWKQTDILVITDHFLLQWEESKDSRKPGTAANPPLPTSTWKSRNHTMLWRVTTPLPRGQGQSCTAVTHGFLFPSSLSSCLVLAREQ